MPPDINYQNLTVEEYLRVDEASEERYEFVGGQLFLMTGASEAHNTIALNLSSLLREYLKGSGCRAFTQGMKLRIQAADCIYYPDVMVTCEGVEPKSLYKAAPVLVAEIPSPSTAMIDEREKLVNYRKLDSLKYYLLIDQNKPEIKLYQRVSDEQWSLTVLGSADELILDLRREREFRSSIAEIYDGLLL